MGDKGRTIEYSAFNKPTRITENSGATVEFVYGADRARVFKQATTVEGKTELTWYVGLGAEGKPIYEQTATLDVSGQPFAVHVQDETEDNNTSTPNLVWDGGTEYYHRDHLGSVIAITGDSGEVRDTRLMSFDAWGKRRNENWREGQIDPGEPPVDQYTGHGMQGNLGYSGHESIPEVGLIHMNGRVYDPDLGRFLSADPNIQFADDTQSYNRYSYVQNNPLRYTDPSGYFSLGDISSGWAAVINIALYYVPGCQSGACSAAFSAAYAKANGATNAQAFISAGASWVGGGFGQAAGAQFGSVFVQGAVSGAIAGGFNSVLSGGSFLRGAVRGAAYGGATAVVMDGIQKAIGALQPEEAGGNFAFDVDVSSGSTASSPEQSLNVDSGPDFNLPEELEGDANIFTEPGAEFGGDIPNGHRIDVIISDSLKEIAEAPDQHTILVRGSGKKVSFVELVNRDPELAKSIIGHELVHIGDHIAAPGGQMIPGTPQHYKSEIKAYQWQLKNRDKFPISNVDKTMPNQIRFEINKYRQYKLDYYSRQR